MLLSKFLQQFTTGVDTFISITFTVSDRHGDKLFITDIKGETPSKGDADPVYIPLDISGACQPIIYGVPHNRPISIGETLNVLVDVEAGDSNEDDEYAYYLIWDQVRFADE